MVAPLLYNECTCLWCWRRGSIAMLAPMLQFRALERYRRAMLCGNKSNNAERLPLWWTCSAAAHLARRGAPATSDVIFMGGPTSDPTSKTAGVFFVDDLALPIMPVSRSLLSSVSRIPVVEHCTVACVSSKVSDNGTRLDLRLVFVLMLTERYRSNSESYVPNLYRVEWRDDLEHEHIRFAVQLAITLADSLPNNNNNYGAPRPRKSATPAPLQQNKTKLLQASGTAQSSSAVSVVKLHVEQPQILHLWWGGNEKGCDSYGKETFSANVQIEASLQLQF
jgi:uncharacterized metal-binding protein